MKEMVNAFSEYARAPRFEMTEVNLNQLVSSSPTSTARRCPAGA